ncbi:MAG: 2-dehydro-3-deoxygalactonokinase [Novosphingobium sp.]
MIYGDWGTTRLRLWRVDHGVVTDTREGLGIGQLDGLPADALRAGIAPWAKAGAPARIVLCGMAGARNSLHEVPYAECPVDSAGWRQAATDLVFDGTELRIMAGVACRVGTARDDGRPDVMRGEETQIFGAVHLHRGLGRGRQIVVLPGTHSKWTTLDDGRITAFRTFLTGELYTLLQGSSLLAAGRESESDAADDAFAAGLARAAEDGGPLGSLFEARAAQLRDGRSAAWAREFISGLLLGSELAEMRRAADLPSRVSVIGGADLAARYARAFAYFGVEADLLDGDACALAGLELNDADG